MFNKRKWMGGDNKCECDEIYMMIDEWISLLSQDQCFYEMSSNHPTP